MKKIFFFIILILINYCAYAQLNTEKNNLEWKLVTKDSVPLYIHEFGEGITVIVIHGGFGAEHSYMLPIMNGITGVYRFVFYDQRGSLRSPCPDSKLTFDKHVEDIEEIRKAIGTERVILVAHSMGGLLAMEYAKRYPDNMLKMVLISPCPATGSIEELTTGLNESAMKRWKRASVISELSRNGLDTVLHKDYTAQQRWMWQHITFSAINLHDCNLWRSVQNSVYYSSEAAAATGKSLGEKWDYSKSLADHHYRIYLIFGDDDYIPLEMHKKWLEKVTKINKYEIKDAGHVCWLDKPEEFRKYLQQSIIIR